MPESILAWWSLERLPRDSLATRLEATMDTIIITMVRAIMDPYLMALGITHRAAITVESRPFC